MMEKETNNPKKEKAGPDGLTKKERRALKVQGKLSQDVPTPTQRENLVNNEPAKVIEKPLAKQNVINKSSQSANKQLSEKELRKLEWEKKLAEQNPSKNGGKESLSKAELRAKRREQQESQRLAKAEQNHEAKAKAAPKSEKPQAIQPEKVKKFVKKVIPARKEAKKGSQANRIQLVQHLYDVVAVKTAYKTITNEIHPAFVRLGVQYSNKIILGSNARCLALLAALKHLVDDLQTPPKQEFCRYLETVLQTCTNYLQNCRPLAVSMTNALKHFKLQLTHVDTNLKDNAKRGALQSVIDTYINDDIKKAGDAISMKVTEKISNGDVILTYGCSSLIRKILVEAHKDGKKFRVIVTDGRPLLEGREMLRRLIVAGIKCTYILINATSYVMNNVTKVMLGAHALLTNGYVMSRIGTAQVALVAKAYNKPVLVCCETYKFSERVQTDSFVYNEIDRAHVSDDENGLKETKLASLNLLYDVTPPDLVTAVVTEIAILPCTSVPVVLRINADEAA